MKLNSVYYFMFYLWTLLCNPLVATMEKTFSKNATMQAEIVKKCLQTPFPQVLRKNNHFTTILCKLIIVIQLLWKMTTIIILSISSRACTGHFLLHVKVAWKTFRYSLFVPFYPYGQFTGVKKKRKYSNTVYIREMVPHAMLCHEIYIDDIKTSIQCCKW